MKIDSDGAIVAQITTTRESPWFPGHFPGDPILPGIAQIDMVTTTIAKVLQKELVLKNLARVKFKQLIRPGDILDIHASVKKENNYSFKITSEQKEVCSGRLVLAQKKEQLITNVN